MSTYNETKVEELTKINETMNQGISKIWIAVLTLIFVVCGILGYVYWWMPRQGEERVEDETAGWKTYSNEKYGYEVKYPSSWQKDKGYQEPEEVAFSDTQFWGDVPITYARLFIRAEKVSKDSIVGWKETILAKPDEWKITKIGDIQAVEQEFEYQSYTGSAKAYTFMSEKMLARYRVVTTILDVKNTPAPGGGTIPESVIDPDRIPLFYQKIFDQILSNFRFLE